MGQDETDKESSLEAGRAVEFARPRSRNCARRQFSPQLLFLPKSPADHNLQNRLLAVATAELADDTPDECLGVSK
jgi:hypothetical protein